jgi:hypothetical protein
LVPLVSPPRSHLTSGELAPSPEGTFVKELSPEGVVVRVEGIVEKI